MSNAMTEHSGRRSRLSGAARVALIYVAVGLAWITGSDRLVEAIVGERYIAIVQLCKGYAYVLVTGYLLYVAIARLLAANAAAQQRLQQSERAYRSLFESHPNPMFVYDDESLHFLAVNRAALDKYGYTRDEFLTLTLHAIRPPETLEEFERIRSVYKHFEAVVAFGPLQHMTKDRRLLDVQITSSPLDFDGNDHARVVLAQDVTERMRAERDMRMAQRELRELQRVARLGVWQIDRRSGAMKLSASMQYLLALSTDKSTIDMEAWFACIHPDDRAPLQQALARAWQGVSLQLEVRVLHERDAVTDLLLRAEVESESDGLFGTALDISARKQTERKMAQSETHYRQLVERLPEAVLLHCEGRVTFANPAAAALFGVATIDDMLGAQIEHFIATPSRQDAQARLQSLQRGLDTATGFQERLLKKANGETFIAEVAAQFTMMEGRRCVQAIVRDISAQKKMRLELQLANERLQHLSAHMVESGENERLQLSRDLHDDLGQSLTYIKMTAAWLGKRIVESELAERVLQIGSSAGEALEKVRNLALSLRPAQLDALGLHAAMDEHVRRFCSGSGIDYALQLQELQPRPQPAIEIALFRIFQEALTNIFRHAGANFIEIELTRREGAIALRIVDDGRGFDVAAAMANGKSLGLHTMRERAQQLHGTLYINSVSGVGTELTAIIAETAL